MFPTESSSVSFPSFWGANNLGTYKTRNDIDTDGRFGRSFLGGPRLEDQNGDGTWNTLDYVYQGSPEPDLFGGIRNVFSYKKWTLDTFAHFSIGNTMFNGSVAESYYARKKLVGMNVCTKTCMNMKFYPGVWEIPIFRPGLRT